MQDIKFRLPVRQVPIHQQVIIGATVLYAPGDWGADRPVGETVKVEVYCRDIQFKFKPVFLAGAETNPNGDFMVIINSSFVRVGKDYVFLSVYDKTSNKKSPFNITGVVNWQLTAQSQLLDPLVVHWGPA